MEYVFVSGFLYIAFSSEITLRNDIQAKDDLGGQSLVRKTSFISFLYSVLNVLDIIDDEALRSGYKLSPNSFNV